MKRTTYIASMLAGALLLGGCAAKKTPPAEPAAGGMNETREQAMPAHMPESVPAYANEVKSGTGALSYTAEANGMLFVVDTQDNVVLYSGQISKDQAFALDAEARRATIDGKYVFTREIDPSHSHKLYFTAE